VAAEFPFTIRKVVSVKGRGAIAVGTACISGYEALGELRNRVVASWLCVLVLLRDRNSSQTSIASGLILSNSSRTTFPARRSLESKNHAPFFEKQWYRKGQFSAPMYSTVVPSSSWTRRCISWYFWLNCSAFELVLRFVARRSDFLSCSEDSFQGRPIFLLCSLKESVAGFRRRRETFLVVNPEQARSGQARDQQQQTHHQQKTTVECEPQATSQ